MERHSYMVLFLVILLAIMAGGAIALDMQAWQGHRAEDTRIFQRATGGLGMGAIATQILLYTSSQPAAIVAKSIGDLTDSGGTRVSCLQIKERSDIDEMLRSGYGHRGGIFTVLFVIGAALAIPAFLITSGFGLRELYKEIGVLKATGWRTREVLEKVTLEKLLISLTAVSLSILLSMVWIKGLNGILIAQFYIAEVGLVPDVDIPSRYLPSHAIFCLLFALGVTLVGGLFSAWNKTRLPPSELMR